MSHTSRFSPVQDCDDSVATVHNWNRTLEMRAYIKELFMPTALFASLYPLTSSIPFDCLCNPNLYTYIFTQCYSGIKLNRRWIFLTVRVFWDVNAVSLDKWLPTFRELLVPSSSRRNTPCNFNLISAYRVRSQQFLLFCTWACFYKCNHHCKTV